ncbi:MAG: diadenylate cyclase [bacterium]
MFEFLQNIDIADVADIAIVAMLIYAGLVWFKKTRAFLVLFGIVILGVVFALARFFNLFLTTAVLQGFFAVLLIAIIVIFQEELRRFFERVALWGLGRHQQPSPIPLALTLARTALNLSRERVGALIVIVGRDPIDRHIEGGHTLEGIPSEALLRSIFDPHSPGHDGAVIIRGDKAVRFAAHLPLSKDPKRIASFGTRHAAALGLAERCDALSIVVSEERGTISLGRDGDLVVLDDPSMLEPAIEDYLKEKFPVVQKRRIVRLITVNQREKIAAILMAAGLWAVFAQGQGTMQRDYVIPIEYANMPEQLVVDRAMPRRLSVTLSGDDRAFRLLNQDAIKATIDLEGAKAGRQIVEVHKEDIGRIPRSLSIEAIHPQVVDLTLRPITEEGRQK